MTIQQWQIAAEVVAELCTRYSIEVTPRTVLGHGEVQATLKIDQLQKWDPVVMPWSPSTPRQQVMDQFRSLVRDHLATLAPAGLASAPIVTSGPFQPQSQDWPGDSAVLLVHGVGNASQGDNADVQQAVQASVGATTAVYSLFYDVFNDWFVEKTQFAMKIGQVMTFLKSQQQSSGQLPDAIAEFAGDVIWPLFSLPSRSAVRSAYLVQLQQMIRDGIRSTNHVKPVRDLRLSIICHSLGCFHTYEVLHAMASDPSLNLRPGTDGVRFRFVVFMASPVQLIRTMGQRVGGLIPPGLATTLAAGLAIPSETVFGTVQKSIHRCVSVTGDLDPIGGHFLRNKADWAYMNITEPESIFVVDNQTLAGSGNLVDDLVGLLRTSRSDLQPPTINLNNPHSWLGYVQRHQADLSTWLA